METTAPVSPAAARTPSFRGGLSAFFLSFLAPLSYKILGPEWALLLGGAAAAWAAYVVVQAIIHPRTNLGKRWALLGLIVSGVAAYVALGDVAEGILWRRAFQLTSELAVYEDPIDKWRVLYPVEWGHQSQSAGEGINHVFKPSKITPAMNFSITCRPHVGTEDLSLIVQGFFMNLPKGAQTDILEKEPTTLPNGQAAYRVVYTELSRRIPLKSEILFVMEKDRLFFLSVESTPRWFDRHRVYLERLLYSLEFPSSES